MKDFLGEDFLLTNKVAEALYHEYAASMPIIDYHNHLPPQDIAADRHFKDITEAWLEGDHYKWRAMRANGIKEGFITGSASSKDKFKKWAETVPYTLRNPLFHWTHMELRRYFGIEELLNEDSADQIFESTQAQLQEANMGCQGLLTQQNVRVVCTTDDPIDDLQYHRTIAESDLELKVYPTFRPDKAMSFDDQDAYNTYLDKLEEVSGKGINSLDDLLQVLRNRIDHFEKHGCRLSDLGFNRLPLFGEASPEKSFEKIRNKRSLTADESSSLQFAILLELCRIYHEKGWVQQFHLGALRNNNARALSELGADTGYDSMGDFDHGVRMSAFFNELNKSDQLTKTIVYNLNPRDNELFATMMGNFNDGEVIGKMQFGSGWWFLDQKIGMESQLNALSNMGLLSRFVGMLTDSRSFLSFPRHEYFRRILCNLIGTDVENGELPNDMKLLGDLVENICYNNANEYFGFNLK